MASDKQKMLCFAQFVLLLLFAKSSSAQRIGSLFQPIHYDLVLLPIISGNGPRLCGHVFVDLEPSATTNLLAFHGNEITVLDVSVIELAKDNETNRMSTGDRLSRVEELCFSGLFEDLSGDVDVIHDEDERQQISVILKKPLLKSKQYRIGLFYVGLVRDENAVGFFRTNYKNDSSSCCHQGWFAGTQMEAAHARKVLPCWDEPAFKATFDITLGHERSMSALSNMPEMSNKSMNKTRDWMWTRFDRSPPMSTYLLAMVITDYKYTERIYKACDRNVRMRFWARPEHLSYLNETISAVPGMLNRLETYLRQPLTVPKLDFISAPIPLLFSAMENWGLILFSDKKMYYNKDKDGETERFEVLQTTAHELAHQFFGNLVTTVWWDDIWFYEGFSGVFEFELVKQVRPDLKFYTEHAFITSMQSTMKVEELSATVPVIRSAETPDEAEKLFDPISYSKGNALLLMLRNAVGHENFRNAIITFMDRYQFQNVRSDKFMEILNEEIHRNRQIGRSMNVTAIMNSWTGQPSYPIVRCERAGNGRIRLSQMPHPGQLPPNENVTQLWWIPLAMTDARRPDFSPEGKFPRVWLTPERPTLEISYFPPELRNQPTDRTNEDNWILINGEMSSYARVLYDEHNLRLLARQLMTDHTVIPQVTRAQLIDDAFTLVLIEKLDYNVVLNLIEYLTVVKDEFVRPTTMLHLIWMKGRIMNRNATLYKLFEEYMARLTFNDGEEPVLSSLVRSGANGELDNVDCVHWNEGSCIDHLLRLFHAQMDGTITIDENKAMMNKLEDNWCTVMRHGGEAEWKWAWETSLSDEWDHKRTKILSAMSCSQDRNRIKKLLSRVFHPSINQNPADTFAMLEKMSENPAARSMALSFIKTNWEFLGRHLRKSGDRLKLLASSSKYLSTPKELEEMSNFLKIQQKKDKKLDRTITTGILDGIRSNNRWMEKHSNELYSLLEAQNSLMRRTRN